MAACHEALLSIDLHFVEDMIIVSVGGFCFLDVLTTCDIVYDLVIVVLLFLRLMMNLVSIVIRSGK